MNEPRRNARLVVAYNGASFHGFALNPEVPTVAGVLRDALTQITQCEVQLVAAGRTDAGVHASGQVVSVMLPSRVEMSSLARRLTAMCGPRIVVREAHWASPDFHARFSAQWRHYRYTILNSASPDPFLADTTWHVHSPLEVRPMQLASDAIMGEKDFSAFCRKPEATDDDDAPVSMRRFVMQAEWRRAGDLVTFDVRANAFCHQMVRSLVGTFVDIGLGRRPPSDMMGLVRSGRRQDASQVAPPHGLCLLEVGYPTEPQ